MKDIYKWWSKKALKNEILKLKNTYNELFDAMLKTQEENGELRKAYDICNKANIDIKEEIKDLRKILNERSYVTLEEDFQRLEEENAELKEKFLTVKKDNVRKAKLNDCKTYEEKVEYLRQVTNYALFNDDISVMLWCFCQRGEIDTDQLTKAKEILKTMLGFMQTFGYSPSMDKFVKEAEQFLKEIENV